jgi:DNA polymerase-3 subunit delta'
MARAPVSSEIVAVPEADCLEGFAHPRMTKALVGYEETERVLGEALQSGRMHHAWLLTGPAGIGKATLAYRFARAALARPDERGMFGDSLDIDPQTATARQVAALSHPGLLVIRRAYDQKAKRFAATISVDDVRRLKSFLAHSTSEDGWRVVIVDSADEMNANAANALLKSLEEPPPRTVFLIISSAPGRLLATIRSRCRVLTIAPLASAPLRRAVTLALEEAGKPIPSPSDWELLETIAGGSVRRALALLENSGLALQSRIDKILAALPKLDGRAAHTLADELQSVQQEQKFLLFGELLQETIARLIKAEATGQGRADDIAAAQRLIGPERLATFAELWETLARDRADALSLNLDRKSLILTGFARLEAACRR